MTKKTLEEVFLNPPPSGGGSKKPTRRIEVTDGHAAVEINGSDSDEVTEDAARDLLRSQGLNPDEWAVAGVRVGEWTKPNGELGVSRRFTFKPALPPTDPDEVLRDFEEVLGDVDWSARPPRSSQNPPSYVIGIGDMQIGKLDGGDTIEGAIERVLTMIDQAALRLITDPPEEIVVAWLGDHVEGFVSQGGASAWRTKLTLTEQSRVVRRLMLYALKVFAPLAPRVTMLAVPGNHGETVRFAGTGITRYDDSHDTEALVCVAEVAAEHESLVLRNVTFLVPENDELTVPFTVGGLKGLAAHGHKWRPGKHFEWWKGQGFHGNGDDAELLIAGHLHHLLVQTDGRRMFVQVPSTELESTWFRHTAGSTGDPGIAVLTVMDGRVTGIELVRP